MAQSPTKPDLPPELPDDERSERYLTLMEHLSELRYRVTVSGIAVVIGLALTAIIADDIIEFLKKPAEDRSENFQLQFIEPFENFVVYFKVALLGGLVLGMPVIVFQVLRFLGPGLRGNERRWLYGTVVGSFIMFITGVLFAYYVAMPPAMDFLLNFNDDLAQPNIRIGSYIDFVTRLLFWTGVSFQMPIIVMYLGRFGVLTPGQMLRWWRYAVVIIAVVAAIITPTIDPVTMSLVMAPLVVLYFLGIILAWLVRRGR